MPRGTLDALGEDHIIGHIEDGLSLREVAKNVGVARSTLQVWLDADPGRSARAREAMKASAEAADDEALRVLKEMPIEEIARARELASHYRWRARVKHPKVYGDRVAVDATVDVTSASAEYLASEAATILAALRGDDSA